MPQIGKFILNPFEVLFAQKMSLKPFLLMNLYAYEPV